MQLATSSTIILLVDNAAYIDTLTTYYVYRPNCFSIMNTYKCILLVFIAAMSTMAAAIDHDKPRRLRIANIADTNQLKLDGRILQTSTMSMATTESTDNIGIGYKYNNNMEVVDAIASKLEEEGETVDPKLAEFLVLAAAVDEYEESAMHHDDEYDYTEKCLNLLFILLPDYKAKKLSFICGETVTTSTTTAGCIGTGNACSAGDTCCEQGMYYSTRAHCTLSFTYNLIQIFLLILFFRSRMHLL